MTPATEATAAEERLTFVCDWFPRAPAAERVVADIRLRSGDANRVPAEADLLALREAGARILHVFNVAMVRVEIATARIAPLIQAADGIADWAATVPDPSVHDVELQLFFDRPPGEAETEAIVALGGRVLGAMGGRGVLWAVAPDAAVPELARLPGATNVRAQAMACAEVHGAEATLLDELPQG